MATNPKFHIPTINISPYLLFPHSPESQEIISQVRTACKTTGFFQLIGHNISPALQKAVLVGSKAFFELPAEEKKKLDKRVVGGPANKGYEVIGTQSLEEAAGADLKEGFYIGQDVPADDPRSIAYPSFIGPNIWPLALPDTVFKEPMTEYLSKVFELSLVIMDILARGLPYGPDVFKEFTSNDPVASIRLLHYPPQSSNKEIGAGAHTDFGAITLLLQDEHSGLEVFNPEGREWVPITPNPEAYVVNVGDMLSLWTKGGYKSALHRVVNEGGVDRYSIPFFFDGNMGTRLVPFGEEDGGEGITVEEHMLERFTSTYGRGKPE